MSALHRFIERHWLKPHPMASLVLYPLSWLFAALSTTRRKWHQRGQKQRHLPIPVVVVGNIHVGGTGKTPITAALVRALQQRGLHVGIISRGYGRQWRMPHLVNAHSQPHQAGDEPILLWQQTHAPIAVASQRLQAAQLLLSHHPDLQLIVCDDGLQHYRLPRDLEIAVYPANTCQHPHLLPHGALREPISRLNHVDAVVLSHHTPHPSQPLPPITCANVFHSHIQATLPHPPNEHTHVLHPKDIAPDAICLAAAAIARPERFFNTLRNLGFTPQQCFVFNDHATIDWAQLRHADYVFITEKDAVKLPDPPPQNVWIVPIWAIIEPDLAQLVCQKLHLTP